MSRSRDQGQAFPVYVVVLTGLLFAAFAFLVIGMGGAKRSDAQGAADAAALAAAQEARDSVFEGVDLLGLARGDWEDILRGDRLNTSGACGKGLAFASMNDAQATCEEALPEFRVSVVTNGTVGNSVIPGTEGVHANARATAVIEPRCTLQSMPSPTPSPSASPSPSPSYPSSPSASPSPETGMPASIGIRCKGGDVLTLDPKRPGSLTKLARKLFSVRLAD
ncbi:pilus assembly protein TadG-related protein [Streptomyces sp. NPDC047014]|uniref:pilus assembly protein TadG-related protein n=1 Tax=Streptomyces sp. NPDC047014 TaxID=3155736 RepID=UPI0033C514A8